MNQKTAALDFIAHCLRPRGVEETLCDLHARVDSLPLGWEGVVRLANQHFVSAALWPAIRTSAIAARLPEDVRRYLVEVNRLNRERNERLKRQAGDVVRHLNHLHITPVLLKGAAHLYTQTFDDPGSRMMADVDVLVRESELERAWNGLLELGYRPRPGRGVDYDTHHHLAPLVRPGMPAAIELHRDVLFTGRELLPRARAWTTARRFESHSLVAKILSPTHQVLQNFWHSEVDDKRYARGRLSLRYLHELVRLDAHYSESVDWNALRRLVERHGKTRVLDAYLYSARRLFGLGASLRPESDFAARLQYQRCRASIGWDWARFVDRRFQGLHFRCTRALERARQPFS